MVLITLLTENSLIYQSYTCKFFRNNSKSWIDPYTDGFVQAVADRNGGDFLHIAGGRGPVDEVLAGFDDVAVAGADEAAVVVEGKKFLPA